MTFFAELARRNVIRVGIAYAVIGWILAQIAEFAFENFGAPEWVLKSFVVVLLLGLPLALFFAWAFEVTPEGVKREEDVDRSSSITGKTGRKLDFFIIGGLVFALGYFVWERQAGDIDTALVLVQGVADTAPADSVTDRSIAVLPFVNMSSDEAQEWFSDGLTEEILNALARTPDLLVSARTSSFKYKGSSEDVPTIAAALGVAHILEGSVRRAKDQLRVTAQLIRASDGFHLWSQTYDRNPEDVIIIQEEIAIEIATALETAMDPEALAQMLSAGTNSVPAFNAYLHGLAAGASSISTGDAYTFLNAQERFELAVELDPQFARAYWELAGFWSVQVTTTNVTSGIIDISHDEMMIRFDDAIQKAIQFEKDPVNRMRYRVLEAAMQSRFPQALRLNTDYLERRPNDQLAQVDQITMLAGMSRDEELFTAIKSYQERGGHDILLNTNSLTFLLVSDDKEYMRSFAQEALRQAGDAAFVQYQAHRTLLWAGDIDGASQLLPLLASSDMPAESRALVRLRQACAEGKLAAAERAYEFLQQNHSDDASMMWISNSIMGRHEAAAQQLMVFDENEEFGVLSDYLGYAYFNAHLYPNLMIFLESQGIEPRVAKDIPYSCKT